MKNLIKAYAMTLALALISSSALASGSYHGAPKSVQAKFARFSPNDNYVVISNDTYDDYHVYAFFPSTGTSIVDHLYPSNQSPYNILTENIVYPDLDVCIELVRDMDGYKAFSACLPSGNILIQATYDVSKPEIVISP